jgi:hypothetical protein
MYVVDLGNLFGVVLWPFPAFCEGFFDNSLVDFTMRDFGLVESGFTVTKHLCSIELRYTVFKC